MTPLLGKINDEAIGGAADFDFAIEEACLLGRFRLVVAGFRRVPVRHAGRLGLGGRAYPDRRKCAGEQKAGRQKSKKTMHPGIQS
jgi:hypothetical protein